MVNYRLTAVIKEDRRVEIVLPPETPVGPIVLNIAFEAVCEPPPARIVRQADWSSMYAEDWGEDLASINAAGCSARQA